MGLVVQDRVLQSSLSTARLQVHLGTGFLSHFRTGLFREGTFFVDFFALFFWIFSCDLAGCETI